MPNILKLSPYQASILADRPDCCIEESLANAIAEPGVPLDDETADSIAFEVASLKRSFGETYEAGEYVYKPERINVITLSNLGRLALMDCWEGSTIDRMTDEWIDDPLAVSRLRRSMVALRGKLQAVGFNPSPVWF